MGVIAEDVVRVRADTTGVTKQVESGMGGVAKKVGLALGGAFAGAKVASFFKGAITGASDLNETMTKVQRVFGPASAQVMKFGQDSATSMGMSKNTALAAVATYGNLFRSMGIGAGQSAKMSTGVTKLAGDLASFNNVAPEEALEAIRSGLVGETEPLRKFGINMNDATLRAQAMKMGLIDAGDKSAGALDPAIKSQAAYGLIMQQSKLAQGDFERTSGGLANQQRILSAQWEDMQTKIGGALLPAVTSIVTVLNANLIPAFDAVGAAVMAVIGFFQEHQNIATALIAGVTALTAAFVAYQVAMTVTAAATKIAAAAQAVFNAVMAANPIGLVVLAIVALAAILFVLYQRNETVRHAIQAAWAFIQSFVPQAIAAVRSAVTTAINAVRDFWNENEHLRAIVQAVWNAIKTYVTTYINIVKQVVMAVMAALRGDWQGAWDHIKQVPKIALDGAISIIKGLGSAFGSAALDIGEKIVDGILDGVGSLGQALQSKVEDLIGSALDSVNPFSPIEVGAAKLLGEPIVAGTLAGVAGLGPALSDAVETGMRQGLAGASTALSAPGVAGAGAGPGVGVGGANVAIHGPVTIQTDDPRRFLDELMGRARHSPRR